MLKKSKFRAAIAALKHKLPWFKVIVPSKVKFTTKITKEQICVCSVVTCLYLMVSEFKDGNIKTVSSRFLSI